MIDKQPATRSRKSRGPDEEWKQYHNTVLKNTKKLAAYRDEMPDHCESECHKSKSSLLKKVSDTWDGLLGREKHHAQIEVLTGAVGFSNAANHKSSLNDVARKLYDIANFVLPSKDIKETQLEAICRRHFASIYSRVYLRLKAARENQQPIQPEVLSQSINGIHALISSFDRKNEMAAMAACLSAYALASKLEGSVDKEVLQAIQYLPALQSNHRPSVELPPEATVYVERIRGILATYAAESNSERPTDTHSWTLDEIETRYLATTLQSWESLPADFRKRDEYIHGLLRQLAAIEAGARDALEAIRTEHATQFHINGHFLDERFGQQHAAVPSEIRAAFSHPI